MNLNNVIQGLSKSGAVSGFAGGLAGTAVAGALTGKKGRKMAKSAAKVGALAAVGGLAYTAYQRYQSGKSQAGGQVQVQERAAPTAVIADRRSALAASTTAAAQNPWVGLQRDGFESVVADTSGTGPALLLVRAMIAAAAADGHMDSGEQARIFSEAQRLELSPDDKAKLFDELRQPLTIHDIVAQVDSPETALEVYTASLVAVDETRPEGEEYLQDLATALKLPPPLVESLRVQAEFIKRDRAA